MSPSSIPIDNKLAWDRVNDTVQKCSERLIAARVAEDFESIAHLCREGLISLAQAVWDPLRHPVSDVDNVSETDAKRKLDAYFSVEFKGSSSAQAAMKKLAKASVELANAVQHRRSASFRDAALSIEAFVALVNIVAVSEKRCSPERPWEITLV